ncbi:MAG TPA: ATP-dependent Clp protease ATP-binding subunit [Blastocatellia bacterium]|nr:ATP-dependent Clp protease ATP-binding subunit [Blastocatellia bacterium]
MFERFTEIARRVVFFARYEASRLGAQAIEPEHILLGILREDSKLSLKCIRNEMTVELIRNDLENRIRRSNNAPAAADLPLSATTMLVFELADEESKKMSRPTIGNEHILLGILRDERSLAARVLFDYGLSPEVVYRQTRRPNDHARASDFERKTPVIAQFSRDLMSDAAFDRLDPLIDRDAEIERIIQILCRRTKNNPVLIGEPGVGKTAIVEGLARRISDGQVPHYLRSKRIVALDLSLVIAGAKYRGQFEERLKGVVKELVENPDYIIFIDELHTLVGAGAAEGSLDAANILKPALARGELQCLGATTPGEFRKTFQKNRSLERRFQPVQIAPPTEAEAIRILEGIKGRYESFHRVCYSRETIDAAVSLAQRYIADRFLPDKAIDVIDEAGARVKLRKAGTRPGAAAEQEMESSLSRAALREVEFNSVAEPPVAVTREDIEEVVALWTGVPVTSLKVEERNRLLKIEDELHARVISQDRAISALARAIRRARAGLKNAGRPIGSFLFLGPTGVGKTEVARTLAEFLFGSEQALIRLDMSEYMEKHAVSKLIGSPPGYVGYEEGGQLTERVKRNPYSILLLDEIEKAHPDIFNILLQVLEDGILTDSLGNAIDFKNVIVVMTSNIGARFIEKRGVLGFQTHEAEEASFQDKVMLAVRQVFSPELINRMDEIIIFDPLTDADLFEITGLMVKRFNSRLVDRNLQVQMTDEAKLWMIERTCGDRSYGARPLRRALQKYVEDPLSDVIISRRFEEASVLEIYVEDDALQFRPLDLDEMSASPDENLVAAH